MYVPNEFLEGVFSSYVSFEDIGRRTVYGKILEFVETYASIYGSVNAFLFDNHARVFPRLKYRMEFFNCTSDSLFVQRVEDYKFPKGLLEK